MISKRTIQETISKLAQLYGKNQLENINKSVASLSAHWLKMDGSEEDFQTFCERYYISDPCEKNALFIKLQDKLEKMFGLSFEIYWSNKWSLMMDTGPVEPIDSMLAEIDPFAHISEDLYRSKLAHLILLNFPLLSLESKNKLENTNTDRLLLAQCRLAELCRSRVSAEIAAFESSAINSSYEYINYLKIDLHRILDENQKPLSNINLTVDVHWGLRDQINFLYRKPDAFHKQILLYKIWERATLEEIPSEYHNNPNILWDPIDNLIYDQQSDQPVEIKSLHQGRYKALLGLFKAKRMEDLSIPYRQNYIDRSFEFERELTEESVRKLLTDFMENPYLLNCASYLKKILKRDLRSFDIIFNQFDIANDHTSNEYDELILEKYPTLTDFYHAIPAILKTLRFDNNFAEDIARQIQVVSCRSGGLSSFPKMKGGKFILATPTDHNKMNYTSFLTAMHELGHCVEGYISLEMSDYYTLGKVPSPAFSESFAYLFDSRSLEILGIEKTSSEKNKFKTLNLFWSCFLNCGLALVDMDIWHWMYDHPECTETDLKSAALRISKDIWNRFYFPVLGDKDSTILAGYSVMITHPLYLPEFALAIFIQTQIEQYLENKSLGIEMVRMCKAGSLTPNQWMREAVGESISSKGLLEKTERIFQNILI